MRLTTEEILRQFPSMWISGYQSDYDKVQGRYYGDLPAYEVKTEFRFQDDKTLCNIEGVDVFVAKCYEPEIVDKYLFHNGDGMKIRNGKIIAGDISIHYGGGNPYSFILFNNHLGINGFRIAKTDVGKYTYQSYNSPCFDWEPWNKNYQRAEIERDTIEKLFHKIETDDEYGKFAREMVKTAREMVGW